MASKVGELEELTYHLVVALPDDLHALSSLARRSEPAVAIASRSEANMSKSFLIESTSRVMPTIKGASVACN